MDESRHVNTSEPQPNTGNPSYRSRAREFLELHEQVQTSVNLLDTLETFLSTFQKDLSAVSGQISDLQDRSKDIENRLKSRRKIEKPLSNLLGDLTIPPPLATIILDTPVGDPWIEAVDDFEQKLEALKVRGRVKAARDLTEVAEGLRIVCATKLRAHFLGLLTPIRTSMTTNLSVIQSSIFLKFRSLYAFLQRQAPSVASEIQRAYVGAVRTYFETGFRRYIRSLGWIKARVTEKPDMIVATEAASEVDIDIDRLSYARIDGPGPVLAYMAEEKAHKEPLEALFRSLLLVLLDNGSAEYSFITAFFCTPPPVTRPSMSSRQSQAGLDSSASMLLSPTGMSSPTTNNFDDLNSNGSEMGWTPRARLTSITSVLGAPPPLSSSASMDTEVKDAKEDQATVNSVWKQIMDPVLEYCQTWITGVLTPHPTIPLLTMIRLTEDVMAEVHKRDCPPLETFIFTVRLKMWPVWQKGMADHVESVKKLAEGSSGSLFKKATTSDGIVQNVCKHYVRLFNSFVALTSQQEETMIFNNLLRLRQELTKLIAAHTDKITDPANKATVQSTIYEQVLQGLSKGSHPVSHPKAQSEIAFWKEREEQARRRILSTRRQR